MSTEFEIESKIKSLKQLLLKDTKNCELSLSLPRPHPRTIVSRELLPPVYLEITNLIKNDLFKWHSDTSKEFEILHFNTARKYSNLIRGGYCATVVAVNGRPPGTPKGLLKSKLLALIDLQKLLKRDTPRSCCPLVNRDLFDKHYNDLLRKLERYSIKASRPVDCETFKNLVVQWHDQYVNYFSDLSTVLVAFMDYACNATCRSWESLHQLLVEADLIFNRETNYFSRKIDAIVRTGPTASSIVVSGGSKGAVATASNVAVVAAKPVATPVSTAAVAIIQANALEQIQCHSDDYTQKIKNSLAVNMATLDNKLKLFGDCCGSLTKNYRNSVQSIETNIKDYFTIFLECHAKVSAESHDIYNTILSLYQI